MWPLHFRNISKSSSFLSSRLPYCIPDHIPTIPQCSCIGLLPIQHQFRLINCSISVCPINNPTSSACCSGKRNQPTSPQKPKTNHMYINRWFSTTILRLKIKYSDLDAAFSRWANKEVKAESGYNDALLTSMCFLLVFGPVDVLVVHLMVRSSCAIARHRPRSGTALLI